MKRKITLKQIAKELDVSISTVSKSLRNSLEIGEETRLKVQAFAKFYHYKPNNIALSLKNRKTKTIGIIIPEIVHHFFSTVINGIEQVANENGYSVIICLSDDSFDKEVLNMEMLANGSIDGFIMSLSKETQFRGDFHHITEVINQGMPVVMFDRVTNDILCDKVIIDDKYAAYEAVQSLIDKGRKKIALVTTVDYVSVGKLRTDGYTKALLDNGIPFNEDLIIKIEDIDTCEITIGKLLEDKAIDAVFAVNELFAVTIIKTANKIGLNVPNDLAVIAFTDGIISKYSTPTITTVSQSGIKMGNKAAKMLIERLESEEDEEDENYKTEVIETHLIERESTN
ncbi:MAG: LacI family DNA-binding transcriptional regulator [Flavobacterium sp.]|jgi:LacI family transcriptional regulator|uniref:LacI family DNA-binding transcriptional regulator n=1 Tax=Flavobacterium algoritolerans TaxID=3041254 RepID=A0ABT6VAQ6_9FLAO|nr:MULTISPECIES: LacI family DNA-binding transcriptional regulator [Flavobacterium]MDI5888960.1 LacI family DNA-binding transcriptional regulator [Flavobacterium yafengii]MDI5895320.1 LacI family DNA-binding transcriptional regulator [Flavobacterium algoritolerans]MDI6049438.1 LacI family DNA-binding transcriptional regulator [Flavobacterium sp. XS2P24]MDP3679427.1 LacI family DNA-binding transcriptional regulator [Flavobacterium sp.]PIF60988.1 LacI family transcriptional regulator [Flavobacte